MELNVFTSILAIGGVAGRCYLFECERKGSTENKAVESDELAVEVRTPLQQLQTYTACRLRLRFCNNITYFTQQVERKNRLIDCLIIF